MKLSIDTSNNLKTIVRLNDVEVIEKYKNPREQRLLELIEKALRKKKIEFQDLRQIEVNNGPGSFTGLRVGCAVANALSWLLKIPINNKRVGELVEPKYE